MIPTDAMRMLIVAALVVAGGVWGLTTAPVAAEADADPPAARQPDPREGGDAPRGPQSAEASDRSDASADRPDERSPRDRAPDAAGRGAADGPGPADRRDGWRQRWLQRRDAMDADQTPPTDSDPAPARPWWMRRAERERGQGGEAGADGGDRRTPEARRAAAREVLREIHPRLADRLAHARQRSPERAERLWNRLGERLAHLAEVRESDPELYRLRVRDHRANLQTLRLARALRHASRTDQTETAQRMTEALRKHLQSHFEIRQEIREHELARLEQRLQRMRGELRERRANKENLIDQVIARARGEATGDAPDTRREQHTASERHRTPESNGQTRPAARDPEPTPAP